MFTPSRDEVRHFFFTTWRKYRSASPFEGLEKTALDILLLHPEYHPLLDQPEKNLHRDYTPEAGAENPFLHLSLHLAVAEQLSIDQPPGITRLYRQLLARCANEHEALHHLLECLGETIWEAQRKKMAPDQDAYLERIRLRV